MLMGNRLSDGQPGLDLDLLYWPGRVLDSIVGHPWNFHG